MLSQYRIWTSKTWDASSLAHVASQAKATLAPACEAGWRLDHQKMEITCWCQGSKCRMWTGPRGIWACQLTALRAFCSASLKCRIGDVVIGHSDTDLWPYEMEGGGISKMFEICNGSGCEAVHSLVGKEF